MSGYERTELDDFLAGIDTVAAAEARAAAARIDELARVGHALSGTERRFIPWGIAAAILFPAGLWMFFNPVTFPRWLTLLCLGALPLTAAIYSWRVRPRTRADAEIETLNSQHFLPQGGLYFPAGERAACVVRVPAQTGVTRDRPWLTRKDIWS